MKVAFDLSSTQSGHQFRGIGFYTQYLWDELQLLNSRDLTITRYQKDQVADLYHFPAFSPFFFSFPLQLIKHSIITVHDLIPLQYKDHYPAGIKGNFRWQAQKIALRLAKHIITDSQASKAAITTITGISEQKITAIHLAADKHSKRVSDNQSLQNTIDTYKLPDKFVLYVGDLNWNKQAVNLARVCASQRYSLVVVGKQAVNPDIDIMHPWNEELVKFQNYAKDYPHIINCIGYVSQENLTNLYNLATTYVMPSIEEGFGLPILDAMSCGCPVLCGNRSSMLEISQDAALHFDPFDSESLKKNLRLIFNDSKLRLELKTKGLKQAQKFNWTKTARQTIQVYKKTI